MRIVEDGKPIGMLFLVHGHQGTLDSDRYGGLSRLVVRNVWRPFQQRFRIPSTTPSRDFALRAGHNDAMYEWAKGRTEKLVLIAGHTHQPVFSDPKIKTERKADIVGEELKLLRETGNATPAQLAALRAEYELVQTQQFGDPPKRMPVPCYFNTGCCSYGDGDVTGIEISDGLIRLVRWLNDESKAEVRELANEPLRGVLEKVKDSHLK
jgi:hypothetical protein